MEEHKISEDRPDQGNAGKAAEPLVDVAGRMRMPCVDQHLIGVAAVMVEQRALD